MNKEEETIFGGSAPVWLRNDKREYDVIVRGRVPNPAVSAIVPVFNMASKGYLIPLMNSLSSQTLMSIEIILVDDFSTDDSVSQMKSFADNHKQFTVVASKKNGHQGAARNIGIELARGQYLGFVDGDDAVSPAFFQTLYEKALSDRSDIVVAPHVITDDNLAVASESRLPFDSELSGDITSSTRSALIMNPAHVVCSLYKRDLFFGTNTWFPENVFFEDNPTCVRLLCFAARISVVDDCEQCVYLYRQHCQSTDHRIDNLDQQIRDRVITSDWILNDAKASNYYFENKDALDLYYFKLCFVNTLNKISSSHHPVSRKKIARLKQHVRECAGVRWDNVMLTQMPRKQRVSFRLAWMLPELYIAVRRLLNR